MGIPYKPHQLTVFPITDWTVAEIAKGRVKGTASATISASLQPVSADYALRSLGFEVRNPHRAFVDAQDADAFQPGYLVSMNGRHFVVRGVMRRTTLFQHGVIILEELEVAL